MKCLILTLLIPLLFAQAKPHPERRELSEHDHNEDNPELHNLQFDHEAFLGKELAAEFDKLTDKESQERLTQKIDQDGDNAIAETELKRWISFVSKTALRADANRHWKNLNANKNEPLAWRDYLERTYGVEDEISSDPERQAQYIKMKRDDERRWNAADMNFDNKLSLDEYSAFLHPQDYPRMRNVVIEETLGSVDTDHDGYISIEEYLVDLAKSYGRPFDPKAPLDDWGQKEKEQFLKHRDRNGDKRLDRQEIGEWIMPTDYDPVEAETKHLIYHADDNKDGKLQEKEVLEHHSLFVGSQALNYGRPLGHEEL
ncbi:Calumenin-B [Echinococcus granulosus]|uniref:Reticulocalbin-3 n=1 Tax=Echinococcus granulosus TaxID=6210 RepID=W6UUR4_ECHGR|nr:Calumenin-B [Echinococcus granulosus]EUB65028.1 Calumenin-B [Echinococcus granulosus]